MDDEEFIRNFESLELPYKEWTHCAHVRVAFISLSRHPFDEALSIVCGRIKAFNAHNDVAEGPLPGCNETTAHAFLHIVLTKKPSPRRIRTRFAFVTRS
ncbi:MAG: hypothetical protein CMO80_16995 [Verrucomicrobiales bacterium]|nr:hypothetical protein [Verrucomicrobiales bacterium]|tara:strand:- start:3201 stop:3497 length:297 start_codon:yes stop_codon:yes gene_type:complete